MNPRQILPSVLFILNTAACLYAGPPQYTIQDLGVFSGDYSIPTGINSSGQVSGYGFVTGGVHAFRYSGGVLTDLGTIGGVSGGSRGYGVNDAGQVTGESQSTTSGGTLRAFLYSGGGMSDLGSGNNSAGYAINNSGQVAGDADFIIAGFTRTHAMLNSGGVTYDLGTLGGSTDSGGRGINSSGQVTGYSNGHAFLYSGGVMNDLGIGVGTSTIGYGINNSAQVTGRMFMPSNHSHAFLYSGGAMNDLGTGTNPNILDSLGYGINNLGQVVGVMSDSTYDHAFLYFSGTMYDLTPLVTNLAGSGFGNLNSATAINDSGQIVGWSYVGVNQRPRAWLLTPVVTAPHIAVEQPAGTNIGNGGAKSFGSSTVGNSTSLAFTIKNTGNADLALSGTPKVAVSGTDAAMFTVTSQPTTPVTGPTGTTPFTVQFAPTSAGAKTAALSITNNDSSATLFTITITGTGLTLLENWRQTWFGTTSNTGNAADTADPYHRGLQNLATFALFGPAQNPATASIAQLPQAQRTAGNFLYSITQPAGVGGVTYGAEWRADLLAGLWTTISDTGTGTQHIFSIPIGTNPQLFLRLKVTNP